ATSPNDTPAACTFTRTSLAFGMGMGSRTSARTSGGPYRGMTTRSFSVAFNGDSDRAGATSAVGASGLAIVSLTTTPHTVTRSYTSNNSCHYLNASKYSYSVERRGECNDSTQNILTGWSRLTRPIGNLIETLRLGHQACSEATAHVANHTRRTSGPS